MMLALSAMRNLVACRMHAGVTNTNIQNVVRFTNCATHEQVRFLRSANPDAGNAS